MENTNTHIALSVIYDVLSGATTMDVATKAHLDACLHCRSEMRWLESMWGFSSRDQQAEPPDWAVSNAINVFQLKRPSLVRFATEVVASLVYDSFNEPAPVGVRSRDLPARQALYKAEGLQLDLKIQLGAEDTGIIIGQVLSEDGMETAPEGLRIDLSQKGDTVQSSSTNEWGEFLFQGLPHGNYEIQLSFPDRLVKLPPLSVTGS